MADTANQKISELPAVSSAAASDVLAGVKSNTTSKFPLSVLKTFFQSGLTKANVGLGNVDNTSDTNKPVSSAQQAAIAAAVQEAESAIPAASSADPQMDGTASAGSATTWSRGDHVHPSDTSRVPNTRTVNGHALSADVGLDADDIPYQGAIGGIAVTNVKEALDYFPTGSNTTPNMDTASGSAGISDNWSRSDHRHPSDTSRVPITRKINNTLLNDDLALFWGGTITLSLSWSGSGPYTQVVSLGTVLLWTGGITANSKIDLQPTPAQIAQLISDGVEALVIENNNGTLTAYAIGAAPSVALTLQCTVMEVMT